MKENTISVILPAYNAEKTIYDAIESILNQSYGDWELIIINDGCKDRTKEIIFGFDDERIRYFENDGNKGLIYTLNRALKLANGGYVARMDADDISLPNRFEDQLAYLIDNNLDLIGCETMHIDEFGSVLLDKANSAYSPNTISKCLRYDNCIAHPTWLGKKEVFTQLGGYRNIHSCEDYDFLLRAKINNFKIGVCNNVLLKYRIVGTGISQSNLLKQNLYMKYLQNNLSNIDQINESVLDGYVAQQSQVIDKKKFLKGYELFNKSIYLLSKKELVPGISIMFKAFISSSMIRWKLKNMLMLRIIRYFC